MPLRDATFVKEYLGLKSEQRVYECARLGLIPSVRIGRQVRFDEDALREWVQRGGSAQPAESNKITSR
jgi:excisionase family DNA binding protein